MSTKLRVRRGDVEIECEGEPEFVREQFPKLMAEIAGLNPFPNGQQTSNNSNDKTVGTIERTTKDIAATMKARTGPDLFIAALAHLQFKGADRAPRLKILEEMKTVSNLYRASMRGNLSKIITGLLRTQKINEPQNDHYCLREETLSDLRSKLT